MGYNYYDFKDAKTTIATALRAKGWKIFGWKDDESDSMTDYYSPACWDGIAEKNGFILLVDINSLHYSEYKSTTRTFNGNTPSKDIQDKISKLENMTVLRGASQQEEETAIRAIEKLLNKIQDGWQEIILETYPKFENINPSTSKWHIEKNGRIYDKGTGIGKFSEFPYNWNITNQKYYYERDNNSISDDLLDLIKSFNTFITRIEKICNQQALTDGTKECEANGIINAGMTKIIDKVIKTSLKMVEVKRNNFLVGDFITLPHHGHYWKITSTIDRKVKVKGIEETRTTFTYTLVGSGKRGYKDIKNTKTYYDYAINMLKSLEEGKTKIFELKEVEEVTEVEKWVKAEQVKPNKAAKESNKESQEATEPIETITSDFTIIEDTDTRDNSPLWVVKIIAKLSREEYIKVNKQLKTLGGYYSKFKHGFIFKNDPTELLNGNSNAPEVRSKIQEQADNIIDNSTAAIELLNLKSNEYETSQEYKTIIADYIKNNNIKVTDQLIDYIEYDGLKCVLKAIKIDLEQAATQFNQAAENNKLIDKVNKGIEGLENKIQSLSGDYQTNTYKRMREQDTRDGKINSLECEKKILEYVLTKLLDNEQVTAVEKALTVGAFRTDIHQYYILKYGKYPQELKFPEINYTVDINGWYNKEVPTRQNKLKKNGVCNTIQLINAVEEYKIIYNSIDRFVNPKEQEIKKLEREYKMLQKNDIHFTPKSLVEKMLSYVDISSNSKILEPSAGIGHIADVIKQYSINIDCIEMMCTFQGLLSLKGFNVVGSDLLNYHNYNHYDYIIMNPPFSNNQDIQHIQHAYKMLKAGGTLIALSSKHWTFANDKASQEFREWTEDKTIDSSSIDQIFEMTNIQTQLIILDKLEETKEQTA